MVPPAWRSDRYSTRIGLRAMILATVISAAAAPLVILGGFAEAVWAWCAGGSAPVPRNRHARDNRAVAPRDRHATAFGIFNAVYGIAWFAGSVLLGILYDRSIAGVVIASTGLQAAALPVLYRLAHQRTGSSA